MNTDISILVRNLKIRAVLILILLGSFDVSAQKEKVVVEWLPALIITDGGVVRNVPNLHNAIYQDGLPYFSKQFNLKDGVYQLSVSNVVSEPAHPEDISLIQTDHLEVPSSPEIKTSQAEDKKGVQVQSGCVPYFKENGQIRRIIGYDFDIVYTGAFSRGKEKSYAANSVLSDGTWYKIAVTQDGVYKMDKAFLQSLGIDVANLNPQHINVYGNSFGIMNESNAAPCVDDLKKNSITVVGESDGVFDDADYVMFYAAGPNRWDLSGGLFNRKQHLYSELSVYFIHIEASDPPQRISTLNNNDSPVNQNVTSYSYYNIHELENTNLVKGGQRWYGELFDAQLSQSFSFNVPNIATNTATVRYAVANNGSSNLNNFKVYYNSALVNTLNLSSGGSDYARNSSSFTFTPVSGTVSLNYVFSRVNASVKGYLDYIELNCRRNLTMMGSQMRFEDLASVGVGNVSRFTLTNVTNDFTIWEISNITNPTRVNAGFANGELSFIQATDTLREFFAFKSSALLVPTAIGLVPNQNLHGLPQVDYVILTHKNFTAQANRLAALHQANGLDVVVVTTEEVYNEFSSGMQDATAIKRFMKMFYDRAAGDVNLQPKSLLLFGDGTYDPKNRLSGNNNFIVTYQFANSENHIAAMVCDDYFGILADNGGIADSDLMQISVGRILVSSVAIAKEQVDKIEHYMKNGSQLFTGSANECCMDQTGTTFGDWRNNYVLITDDEENGYFIHTDAEPVSDEVHGLTPELNVDKIYSDAYQQISSAGGARYPEVFNAITNRVERGSLLLNYIGHGGEVGAAEERIITIPQIQSWQNINKLNCFVTATCEFTRFDDPSRVSAGEWIQLNPTGGAVALMTTTRSVTFTVNTNTVEAFYQYVFSRDANFEPLTFGEIMRLTKNNSGTGNNRRSFMLLGDPELKIALPRHKIVIDSINHLDPAIEMDTIRALSVASIAGHFEDYNGNVLNSINGVLTPTVFDKAKQTQTLGNDSGSPVISYLTQRNAIYKGQATVTNGQFNFDFFVPKDIVYAYGKGKISLYGATTTTDANGLDTNFYVGGINTSAPVDNVGPEVELYMNDKNFVNGGITSTTPLLVVEASDEFGINTVGNGIGHDLLAIIDGETSNPIVLNDYYVGDLDSYKSGKIKYNLSSLAPGKHYMEVKIWDSNNNSSTARIDFEVREEENVELSHVLNYPNPFTTNTTFFFEHNQSCTNLETQIQIYTVTGKLVKTINENVPTAGFRVEGISWDGKDEFGDPLAKGVYVYRVTVELATGEVASKTEKLFLLK